MNFSLRCFQYSFYSFFFRNIKHIPKQFNTILFCFSPNLSTAFENEHSELVNKVIATIKQEIKGYIRASFPLFNPAYKFEYKIYQVPVRDAELEISLTYRENEDGTIFLSLDFGKHFGEESIKSFTYCDESHSDEDEEEDSTIQLN